MVDFILLTLMYICAYMSNMNWKLLGNCWWKLTSYYCVFCLQTAGESPPAPTRGVAAATGDEDDEEEEEEEASPSKTGAAAKPQSLADLMPKVDIRCAYVCACVCMYVCVYVCMCVCVFWAS